MDFTNAGTELASLAPRGYQHWWPIIADVFTSSAVSALRRRFIEQVLADNEFEILSIDGTMKCCAPLLGQAHWRANAITRAAAAFPDEDSKRKVLTVRGSSSCVLGMWPIAEECRVGVSSP